MSINSDIKKFLTSILELSEQRSALNATITAERKKLRALGMTTANINEALRTLNADGPQRGNEDYGRNMFRAAYGFPTEFEKVLDNIEATEAANKAPAASAAPVH